MKRTLAVALAFAIVGCVQEDVAEKRPGVTMIRIRVKGSEAMRPLVARLGERFHRSNRTVAFKVDGGGTTAGLAALASGWTDIAAASRPITAEERAKVPDVVETPVGFEAVAFYVNIANRTNELTPQQIASILSGTTTMWSDVGGPKAPIVVYGEKDKNDLAASIVQPAVTPKPQRDFADAAGTVAAVSTDPYAFGYAGYLPHTCVVWINTPNGAVAPSERTIRDGSYPLTARFYLYTRSNAPADVKRFVKWARSPAARVDYETSGAVIQ